MNEQKLREALEFIAYGKQHSGVIPCPQDYEFYIEPFRKAAREALAASEPRQAREFDARALISSFLRDLESERMAGMSIPLTIRNLMPLAERAYAAGQAAPVTAQLSEQKLREALESVQWSSTDGIEAICPRCGKSEREGHNRVCTIAAALAASEPAPISITVEGNTGVAAVIGALKAAGYNIVRDAESRQAGFDAPQVARDIVVDYDLHCESIDDPDAVWLEGRVVDELKAAYAAGQAASGAHRCDWSQHSWPREGESLMDYAKRLHEEDTLAAPATAELSEEQVREQFEAWWWKRHPDYTSELLKRTSKSGAYDSNWVNGMWLAWNAALLRTQPVSGATKGT